MQRVALVDREGFAQPVEAASVLIPSDWRWEGGVRWNPRATCASDAVTFEARATSADGRFGIEFFPPRSWQWSDDPAAQQLGAMQQASGGCPFARPVPAAEFVATTLVPSSRRGARIVRSEPLAEIAALQQRAGEAQVAPLIQAGTATGYRVDAARVRLAFEVGGKPVEEWVSGTVKTLGLRAASASAAAQGYVAYTTSYNVLADDLVAVRAPAGELDANGRLFAAIVGSIRKNQRYLAALEEVFANVGRAQIEGARQRSAIWTRHAHETNELITRGYEAQQAVQDRLARSYSEASRGVETFVDPRTSEPVDLAGGYERAWVNARGEYLLSSEPGFDPGVALQEEWTELRRRER
jgi:hypothetical protein